MAETLCGSVRKAHRTRSGLAGRANQHPKIRITERWGLREAESSFRLYSGLYKAT